MKACPFCAEEIKDEAVKCKHCGSMLDGTGQAAPSHPTVQLPLHAGGWVAVALAALVGGAIGIVVLQYGHHLCGPWSPCLQSQVVPGFMGGGLFGALIGGAVVGLGRLLGKGVARWPFLLVGVLAFAVFCRWAWVHFALPYFYADPYRYGL